MKLRRFNENIINAGMLDHVKQILNTFLDDVDFTFTHEQFYISRDNEDDFIVFNKKPAFISKYTEGYRIRLRQSGDYQMIPDDYINFGMMLKRLENEYELEYEFKCNSEYELEFSLHVTGEDIENERIESKQLKELKSIIDDTFIADINHFNIGSSGNIISRDDRAKKLHEYVKQLPKIIDSGLGTTIQHYHCAIKNDANGSISQLSLGFRKLGATTYFTFNGPESKFMLDYMKSLD